MGCERRVLLAFSGGNDSCAAVGILRAQGYEPTLLTLDMTGDRSLLARARRAAEALDTPLLTADVRTSFTRQVVDYFASGYLTGETPAPCTECNSRIKWNTLRDVSIERGIGHIATGHYFRLSRQYGKVFVRQAADPAKDQSYYLWGVSQSCLERAIAPMGETLKREAGERLPAGLKSPESMGICFLRGENYREFLRRRAPNGIRPGEIVDRNGKRIGTHDGYAFYTVGQKRGLGLPPFAGRRGHRRRPEQADRRRRRGIAAAPSDNPRMERSGHGTALPLPGATRRDPGHRPQSGRIRTCPSRARPTACRARVSGMGACARTTSRLLRTRHRAGRRHSGGQRIDRPAHFSHKGNETGFPTDENMCTRTPGQSSRCTQGCAPHERPYRSMSRMCKKRSPILFTVPAFESVPLIFPGSPYASYDERVHGRPNRMRTCGRMPRSNNIIGDGEHA